MSRMRTIFTSLGCLGLLVASAIIYGCATPSYVHPTTQPGGFQTPGIEFYPPPEGVPQLPAGFHACGQYSAPVDFEDGSTMEVFGCLYCADDPNDRTVYLQPNCTGYYRKGIRTSAHQQSQPPVMVPTKRLSKVSGDLGEEFSTISFIVENEFELEPEILVFSDDGDALVNNVSVKIWASMGVTKFAPGQTVTLSGTNGEVASTLFWQFGASGVDATTDLGDELNLRVGYSELLGMVVVPFLNGEPLQDEVSFLPWNPGASNGAGSTGSRQ